MRGLSLVVASGEPLFITVRGPLTIAAPLAAEHRLQTRRLSNCGSRAQSLRGMWDPPRPGLEPVSPALAGRLSTTAPPGKPYTLVLKRLLLRYLKIIRVKRAGISEIVGPRITQAEKVGSFDEAIWRTPN